MVQFHTRYINPFDTRYYPSEIGTTVNPVQEAAQGVDAQLRTGAKLVEINVGDIGQGWAARSRGAPIPVGAYGKEQRQELKELGKVTGTTLTVHAGSSTPIAPETEEGGFDEYTRNRALAELKANVDFAHDIGAENVTVHLIGNVRPIAGKELGGAIEQEKIGTQGLTQIKLVDMKTGKALGAIDPTTDVKLPIIRFDSNKDKWNYEYDPDTGGIKTYGYKTFGEAVNEFSKMSEEKKEELGLKGKSGISIAIAHFLKQGEISERALYDEYSKRAKDTHEQYENIDRLIGFREGNLTPEDYLKKLEKDDTNFKRFSRWYNIEGGSKLKTLSKEELEEIKNKYELERNGYMERAGHHLIQLNQTEERTKKYGDYDMRVQPSVKLAEEKNIEGIAELALYSYNKSLTTGNKIAVMPENIFPQYYGAHPDELKSVIMKAREKLTQKLIGGGIKKEKAPEIARDYIKATFDTGHAYMWKRYWKESDEKFHKWIADKAEELAKEGIIGKVHINDNFGYEDDSLAPGEGIVRNKEIVDRIRKHTGKIPIISEGYGQKRGEEWRQIAEAWRHFNPYVYDQSYIMKGGAPEMWDKLQYFSRARSYSPTFLFGPIAPSEDFRTFSELPLE